eukprot:6422002-Amphidinium_carterae.1
MSSITTPSGYTIAHSSTFVETTCAGTTATLRTVWMYRWCFAPSTTPTCLGDAHHSRMMMPSRRSSPTTIVHAHQESLTSLTEQCCRQDTRPSTTYLQARKTGLGSGIQQLQSSARRTGTKSSFCELFSLHLCEDTLQTLTLVAKLAWKPVNCMMEGPLIYGESL